jgi:ATP-dependent RNA helicase DDX23/PRP28
VGGGGQAETATQDLLNPSQFKPPVIVPVNIKRNCEMVAKDIKSWGG